MGRIRTSFTKSITRDIMKEYGDRFTTDFDENKKIIDQVVDVTSKKIRNKLAGYMTFLKKNEEKI